MRLTQRTSAAFTLVALCAVLRPSPAAAQSSERAAASYDVAVAAGSGITSGNLGALRRHAFFSSGWLLLGYGARASFLTGNLKLTPAQRNATGGGVDTLAVGNVRVLTLNVSAHVAVKIAEPFEVGMNIDVFGFGAGGSTNTTYRGSAAPTPVGVNASPSTSNLFLFGSMDRGSLNSEFYVAWRVKPAFSVRGGLSHFLAEFRTDRPLGNTDRFRRYSNLAFVAVRFTRGAK